MDGGSNAQVKIKVTNNNQFLKLVEMMEANPNIARGIPDFGKTKESVSEFWRELAVTLNSLGPPIKETAEWRKVWSDFKRHVKLKISKNKVEVHGIGGGQNTQCPLNPLEQQVDALVNLSKSGVSSGMTFGLTNCSNPETPGITTFSEVNSTLSELRSTGDIEIEVIDNIENNQSQSNINNRPSRQSTTRNNPGVADIEKKRVQFLEKQTNNQSEIVEI